jgi:hypothetical protein
MCSRNLRIYLFYIPIFILSICLGLISYNYFRSEKTCQNLPEYEDLIISSNKLSNLSNTTNSIRFTKENSQPQRFKIYNTYTCAGE